jgi:hypothetical protein
VHTLRIFKSTCTQMVAIPANAHILY